MVEQTYGNPWFIHNLIKELTGEKRDEVTKEQKLNIIKEHLSLAVNEKGEYIAIREMRKHICWYIKNLKDSSIMRDRINKIEKTSELIECLEEYFKLI